MLQAAHETEVASLRAAIHAAEEQCRELSAKHEEEAEETEGTISDLREEIEQLREKAAALEATAGGTRLAKA